MSPREQVIAIAQQVFDEDITPAVAVLKLSEHSALPEADRTRLLAELVGEIENAADIALGDYDRGMCGPGEDDQFLSEDADRRVNDAADALLAAAKTTPLTEKDAA